MRHNGPVRHALFVLVGAVLFGTFDTNARTAQAYGPTAATRLSHTFPDKKPSQQPLEPPNAGHP